jgi:hypothetical protein
MFKKSLKGGKGVMNSVESSVKLGRQSRRSRKAKQYVASFQISCRVFLLQASIIIQVFPQTKFSFPSAKGSPELTRYHD